MLKKLTSKATQIAGRAALKLKKHSPEILVGAGIVGFIATVVTASQASLKVDETLNPYNEDLTTIRNAHENHSDTYTDEDYKHDLFVTYSKIGISLVKLYAVPTAIGLASVTCFVGAHIIMEKRNTALTGALVAVQGAFNSYRQKVIEAEGKDADERYYHGLSKETIARKETDENGEVHDINEVVQKEIGKNISPYAKFFDESSQYWQKQAEYNYMFLRSQQNYANDLLKMRGHLFLNEVYEMLGIPHTQLGAVTGWIANGDGDGYVDFNLTDFTREKVRDFVNGYERSILLDFNVDGVIYNLI